MEEPLNVLSLAQLRERTSMKWRRYPPDVLPLWVAEMDVALAKPIVRALEHAIAIGDSGYAEGTPYALAFAEFARERWAWELDACATANVPDVMEGVAAILELVTDPGGAVVVNCPVYPPFYGFVEHIGRRVIEAPLDDAHRIDGAALDAAFAAAVADSARAAFLLCSPHNPTGTVHTRAELETVGELAERHGVRVIADEIHAPLVLDGATHVPYLSLARSGNSFALLSASKGWNLAGMKAAVAVAGAQSAEDLARLPEEVRHGSSHIGVIAHVAALREGGAWLDGLLGGLDANRRLLRGLLAEQLPEVVYREPQGTYLAWLDCRGLELGEDPASVFLERGRVALSSGPRFGSGGAGHVRLNLATSPQILAEAVERMASALR